MYPVVFALMEKKTKSLYDAILKKLKEIYNQRFPGTTFKVETVMTDFEVAMQQAFKENFRGVVTKGCHFHYAQV